MMRLRFTHTLVSGYRTGPAESVDVLASTMVGRLRVEVYGHWHGGELVYRVLIGGRRILCDSRSDEKRFPKRAARIGCWLIEQVRNGRAVDRPCHTQLELQPC